MTGEAVKRFCFVTALGLLMAVSVLVQLHGVLAKGPPRLCQGASMHQALTTTVTSAATTSPPVSAPVATASSAPAPIDTSTPTRTQTPVSNLTPTLTSRPTAAETPTTTLTETPEATAAPTVATPLNLKPTPSRIVAIARSLRQDSLILWGCFCVLLLSLGLLLILWAFRWERPQSSSVPPSPPTIPSSSHLEGVGFPDKPRRFGLHPGGFIIGRAEDNDLVITDDFPAWESVSRRHARIYQEAGRWVVEDLGSMNGVYVNGRRTGRNLLRDGWRLGIGGSEFVFHAGTREERG